GAQQQQVGGSSQRRAQRVWGPHLEVGGAHQDSHAWAETITPRHSPNPIVANPSRLQLPRSVTSSPSCRKVRLSPPRSARGSLPPQVSSSRQPRFSLAGPETVPLASRSPGRRLQPLLA